MISKDQALKYLEIVHQLKGECAFYDVHAHPFEIFHDKEEYTRHPRDRRIYASDGSDFVPPSISDVLIDTDTRSRSVLRLFSRAAGLAQLGDAFRHTGPGVFEQHGAVSGMDHVLLLPVANPDGPGEARMTEMARMFDQKDRFLPGGCIPGSVETVNIDRYLRDAADRFGWRAVKLHPPVNGLDPSASSGRDRIEAVLEACGRCGLPVVIHGGRCPVLKNSPASDYGVLKNLCRIDWGAGGAPVVIAHAGLYGYDIESIERTLLLTLNRLLEQYDHLRVDLSGLNAGAISLILKNTDQHRVLFGSDMLYEIQWQMVVRTMYAIEHSGGPLEESFIRMAGQNPAAIFSG